ncbi:MAG: sigma-70 family RNA polymerase sigma factor [Akkermansiaceae bacterium]|nr:sigma-70 family RNA polymerase sigma factor [Akkermansiaceae bacterium]
MFTATRPPDPDQELVTRAQEGDTRAYDALILKHGDRLFGLIYQMTGSRDDTHDLLQDTFAKGYRSLQGFRRTANFSTWIHQIAVNLTLNFLKRRKRRQTVSLSELDETGRQDPSMVDSSLQADPERQSSLGELQKKLNEALAQLSDAHRMVVTMFDIQGMAHAEIARILRTSEGTVRSRLHYAHLLLQSALKDQWDERF